MCILTISIASSQPCSHSHGSPKKDEVNTEFLDIASFLEAQFGTVDLNENENKIYVCMDGANATVDTLKFVSRFCNILCVCACIYINCWDLLVGC